jgi:small subunit ribosomal protein S6
LAAAREYELVLMLDPGRDAPARDALADEAKKQIEGGGTLKHENNWGLRKMAYEIDRRNEADYRWFRFEAPTSLLESLDHNLKIADGVLRFRIFKVDPDAPVMVPPAVAAPVPGREGREGREGRDSREGRDRAPQAAAVGDTDDDSAE